RVMSVVCFDFIGALLNFFLHAEDGIRARNVTGVQTFALPISLSDVQIEAIRYRGKVTNRLDLHIGKGHALDDRLDLLRGNGKGRSEERRVGRECREPMTRYQKKKNA